MYDFVSVIGVYAPMTMEGSVLWKAMESSVLSLPTKTLRILVNALESSAPRGNDWRGLAEWLGFTSRQIQAIEAVRGDSFTRRVLSAWDRSNESSVKKLIIALISMERIDCVKELEKGLCLSGEIKDSVSVEGHSTKFSTLQGRT